MDREGFQKAYGKLMIKAWSDEYFKAKLLADPLTAFKEYGIEIPKGIKVRILENTDKLVHFVLPPKPKEELTDEQLENISAGNSWGTDWGMHGYY